MRSPLRAAIAALSLALAVAAAPSGAEAQQPKLGYVDVEQVMNQIPGRADAQATFEKEAQGIRAELQRMSDSLQQRVQAYQREQASLSAAQRQAREKALQELQQGYQTRAQALQERGAQREQELTGGFESLVRDAINDVRTADGYSMIFAFGPSSALLSSDKSLDVTDKVLARMRTIAATRPTAGRSTTTPTPTGAPVAAPAGVSRPGTRPPGN